MVREKALLAVGSTCCKNGTFLAVDFNDLYDEGGNGEHLKCEPEMRENPGHGGGASPEAGAIFLRKCMQGNSHK